MMKCVCGEEVKVEWNEDTVIWQVECKNRKCRKRVQSRFTQEAEIMWTAAMMALQKKAKK